MKRKIIIPDMEVGDYVRTWNGLIGKCASKTLLTNAEYKYYITHLNGGGMSIMQEHVKTYSKNILDLLEKGDIFLTASGGIHKVEDVKDGFIRDIGYAVSKGTTTIIKAIMTKEQFEKMAYKVGEE